MDVQKYVTVKDLTVYYPAEQSLFSFGGKKYVRAVDGVSFEVGKGEIVALVGESGCGKTTVAKTMMALQRPTSGSIRYSFANGAAELDKDTMDPSVREHVQYVFQDPYSSLNPRMKIRTTLERPMRCFSHLVQDRDKRVAELISMVGLSKEHLERYPHEFSGGQKQRISIARSLAGDPEFIIADEPTAALDVSIQGQILNLLLELRDKLGLTILLVTHDLGIVRQIADRVVVMYLGKVMETGSVGDVFSQPLHPYTRSLIDAMPCGPGAERRDRVRLHGSPPSPIDPPAGCRLHTRCPYARQACAQQEPIMNTVSDGRAVRCHLVP